jgi:hypothetical protein
MALHPDDPWYVLPGDPRYRRAQALSEMRDFIETTERSHLSIQKQRAGKVQARRFMLAHWQEYLDEKISLAKGRQPSSERFAKVHITLPPDLYRKVLGLRRDGESESALIARLLDSHPEIRG